MKNIFLSILFISLFMTSCKCSKSSQSNEEILEFSTEQVWQLTHIRENKVSYNGAEPITMQFNPESSAVNGFAGCNRYSGTYTNKVADTPEAGTQGEISFSNVGCTKMMCPDNEMRLEDKFLPMIEKVTGYSLTAYTLVFFQKDKEIMRFEKQ